MHMNKCTNDFLDFTFGSNRRMDTFDIIDILPHVNIQVFSLILIDIRYN